MIVLKFNQRVEYPNLKEAQVVVCTEPSFFCDGSNYKVGDKFVVNKSYFNIFLNKSYENYSTLR